MEQQTSRPRRGNSYDNGAYDNHYAPLSPSVYAVQPPKRDSTNLDGTALVFKVGQVIGFVITVACAAIYLRDFQSSTVFYQEKVTNKLDELVKTMENMTTARDLSDFCVSAQIENAALGWKCPAAFTLQRHRQGSFHSKEPVRIRLGAKE